MEKENIGPANPKISDKEIMEKENIGPANPKISDKEIDEDQERTDERFYDDKEEQEWREQKWKDARVFDPKEVKKWEADFGFSNAISFLNEEFDLITAGEWKKNGFYDGREAADWRNHNFNPKEAKKWKNAKLFVPDQGFDKSNAYVASIWRDYRGLSPNEAKAWEQAGFSCGKGTDEESVFKHGMSIPDTIEKVEQYWEEKIGIPKAEVMEWKKKGITFWEAKEVYKEIGVKNSDEAIRWIRLMNGKDTWAHLSKEDLKEWIELGISSIEAKEMMEKHIRPYILKLGRKNGLTDEKIKTQSESERKKMEQEANFERLKKTINTLNNQQFKIETSGRYLKITKGGNISWHWYIGMSNGEPLWKSESVYDLEEVKDFKEILDGTIKIYFEEYDNFETLMGKLSSLKEDYLFSAYYSVRHGNGGHDIAGYPPGRYGDYEYTKIKWDSDDKAVLFNNPRWKEL